MFEFKKKQYTTNLIIELNKAMPHYNEICIENSTRKKTTKTKKAKNKNFRKNPNYTNLICPNHTPDGIFL